MKYTINNEPIAPVEAIEDLKELSKEVDEFLTLNELNQLITIYQSVLNRIESESLQQLDKIVKIDDFKE